jgi:AcrR family transcriptional regulator
MKEKRSYVMRARSAAVDETRRRILVATRDLGLETMSLEIVLRDVAARADVSVQTVLRHFGSRDGLFAATMEFVQSDLLREREVPAGGDVGSAVTALFDEYESNGDWVITMLGREGTDPAVRQMTDRGRQMHRHWVRSAFGPLLSPGRLLGEEAVDLLVVATDVYTWKLLRRDRGLDRPDAEHRVRTLISAVLAAIP